MKHERPGHRIKYQLYSINQGEQPFVTTLSPQSFYVFTIERRDSHLARASRVIDVGLWAAVGPNGGGIYGSHGPPRPWGIAPIRRGVIHSARYGHNKDFLLT